MEQRSLFDPRPEPPFQRHSETSQQAAQSVLPRTGTLRRKVLDYLLSCEDGATDDEMQAALDMNGSTQRPRRIELEQSGLVVKTDQKRKTRGGELASVYIAAPINASKEDA